MGMMREKKNAPAKTGYAQRLMPKIFKMECPPLTKRAAKSEAKMRGFEPGF